LGAGAYPQQDVLQPVCGIYSETIRDSTAENGWTSAVLARVTAHEIICHGLDLAHNPGNLCNASFNDSPSGAILSDALLARLRRLPAPRLNP
jgi:hypothetical protein